MPQSKKKPFTHCEKYGHTWISTTADNYRKCDHSGCNAAQRLIAGTWNMVLVQKENNSSSTEKPEPVSLWG